MRKSDKREWRKIILLIGAVLVAMFLFSSGALAQSACAERTEVLEQLANKYKEQPRVMGVANNGGVIEILTSPTGSFTIIITMPNGVSCLVAAGESFEILPVVNKSGYGA